MKKSKPLPKARNFEYPTETQGSKLAAQIRQEANKLTETERRQLFERGVHIIYGRSARKEKARSGQ